MQRLLKAIVVEDDPLLCRLFAETLEGDSRITTAQAHDLPEAVRLCRKEPQVLLLVDLSIPGAEGMQAVSALRKEAPGATVVVITGNSDSEAAALRAGAHAVIIKGSEDSHGAALIDAVRHAVLAHEVELMFAPTLLAVDKVTRKAQLVSDSVRAPAPRMDKNGSDPLMARIVTDSKGIIRNVNPALTGILGWGHSDLVGQPLTLIMPDRYRPVYRRKLALALDTIGDIQRDDLPLEALRKDGTECPVWVGIMKTVVDGTVVFNGAIKPRVL
jgi:two-component system cell cycle response regulator